MNRNKKLAMQHAERLMRVSHGDIQQHVFEHYSEESALPSAVLLVHCLQHDWFCAVCRATSSELPERDTSDVENGRWVATLTPEPLRLLMEQVFPAAVRDAIDNCEPHWTPVVVRVRNHTGYFEHQSPHNALVIDVHSDRDRFVDLVRTQRLAMNEFAPDSGYEVPTVKQASERLDAVLDSGVTDRTRIFLDLVCCVRSDQPRQGH